MSVELSRHSNMTLTSVSVRKHKDHVSPTLAHFTITTNLLLYCIVIYLQHTFCPTLREVIAIKSGGGGDTAI